MYKQCVECVSLNHINIQFSKIKHNTTGLSQISSLFYYRLIVENIRIIISSDFRHVFLCDGKGGGGGGGGGMFLSDSLQRTRITVYSDFCYVF